MARLPKVKLRAIPVFPSKVIGGNATKVTKTNGIWSVSVDVSGVHIAAVLTEDTATTYAFSWGGVTDDNPDGVYQLVPFSGFQASSADLTSLADLGTFGIVARIADADYATRTLTPGTGIGITNGGGIAGDPTIAINDAELLALAGVTSAADRLFYFTGLGTGSLATFTSFGRSLVDDADAATARATLGLASPATTTPAALTKTDDTNVTLTLGGTPATALLQATSITVVWSGQLSVARGGTGISSFGTGVATALGVNVGSAGGFVTSPVANANLANSTISGIALGSALGTLTFGAHLISGGASYNGSAGVTITSDATAANTASTIMARDGSGQVAATTFTGALAGNAATATTAATVTTNANLTGDVTSVGNATTIGSHKVTRAMEAQGVARSVIGVTGNATADVADIQGTASQFLGVNSGGTALAFQTMSGDATLSGGAIAVTKTGGVAFATVATSGSASDLGTGTLPAGRLPNPSASTLGGIQSAAAVSHQWLASISTSGVPALSQPAFTDISGSVAASQTPALTGDITTSAGTVATTLATVNANVGTWGSSVSAPSFTVNGKGLLTAVTQNVITPALGSITGTGTGVLTALAINVGSAGAFVTNGGAGGTPSSITLTNGSGLPTTGLTGTLQAAQEPAHTGDATNSAGSLALTLATVNSNVGSFGSVNTVPIITVNGKGLVTAASTATIREVLTATRTYYVRTDGSDSNTGLANTAGGGFLTVQKAVDIISGLDIAGFTVTIQIADGTYTGAVVLKNPIGFAAVGNLVIQGNNSTPANVVMSMTSNTAFTADSLFVTWDIKDLKITAATTGNGIYAKNGSRVRFGNLNFGAIANSQIIGDTGAIITALSSYAVSGAFSFHWNAGNGACIFVNGGLTVTITGTPAIAGSWASAGSLSNISCWGLTFTGSATGTRYSSTNNGVIFTNSGGATYLPGNTVGSTANGGIYI